MRRVGKYIPNFVFAIATASLVAAGGFATHNLSAFAESGQDVGHTLEVVGEIETTLAGLLDAEAGQCGYVIIGDSQNG